MCNETEYIGGKALTMHYRMAMTKSLWGKTLYTLYYIMTFKVTNYAVRWNTGPSCHVLAPLTSSCSEKIDDSKPLQTQTALWKPYNRINVSALNGEGSSILHQ